MANTWETIGTITDPKQIPFNPQTFGAPGTTASDKEAGIRSEADINVKKPPKERNKDKAPYADPMKDQGWETLEPKKPDQQWETIEPKSLGVQAIETFRQGKKDLTNLAVDLLDFPLSAPAYLGGMGAGMVASELHAVDPSKPAGTHFGAANEVANAVMEKYGSPLRRSLTALGILESPKEGEHTSVPAAVMGAYGEATTKIGEGMAELTGSTELGDFTQFSLNYLAPTVGAKVMHTAGETTSAKQYNQGVRETYVAEHLDSNIHVSSWKEQLHQESPEVQLAQARHNAEAMQKEVDKYEKVGPLKKKEEALALKQVFLDKIKKLETPSKEIPVETRPITPEELAQGKSHLAFRQDALEDKPEHIVIDPEAVKHSYETSGPEDRPHIKETYKTVEDYQDHIIEHEKAHAANPKLEGETDITYEKRMNAIAKDKVLSRIEAKRIPKSHEVGDAKDFNDKGLQVLKAHGEEVADRWAFDVLHWKRNKEVGIPETPKHLQDALYRLGKNKEADKVETTEMLVAAEKDGVTPEMKIRWREYAEGERKELSLEEQSLFNKYYQPFAEERTTILKALQDKGWILPVELTSENVARMTNPPKGPTLFERIKTTLTEGHQGGMDANIEKAPGAAIERNLFVAEYPNGRRVVVQKQGTRLYKWEAKPTLEGPIEKKKSILFEKAPEDLKVGDRIGNSPVKLREARLNELQEHTNYTFNQDSQAVLYKRLQELRDFYRSKQLLEDFKKSPLFAEVAHKIETGTEIPKGFIRPKHLDKLPELNGYAFEKNIAHIIEDFAKQWDPTVLTSVTKLLIKNMMLNPLPHMMNEAWHVWNVRGLSGWVTPVGIARFIQTGMPAVQEVMQQGPQFRSLLRDGASLLSADVRNNHIQNMFLEKGNQEFIVSIEGRNLAEKFGMKPLELYNALSRKSSVAMWVVRDAMYMQVLKEKMLKGMTQKEAIAETERHMPAYKLPTKVLGSRMLSETLQNPNVTIFSRYHYGMMRSLVETAIDLSGKHGKEGFYHGVDTAAAIVVALAVMYPMQDMIAQAMTGNSDATTRRAGPFHPIWAIHEIAQGEKDPQAFLASVFTFNPTLLYGAQLALNRKLYNGQPVYSPTDDPKIIAKDVWKYTYTQVPQVSSSVQVMDEKKGGGFPQFVARQLDIKSPTKAELKTKEMWKRKAETASKNKAKKERKGQY